MQQIPEYSNEDVCERLVALGIDPHLQDYFKRCIDFHTYAAPGILIGVFMVDYALDLIGKTPADKIFVTCESYKCLPDAPQVIMHATVGNHQLQVLPIGKFAITLTPFTAKEYAEGVRVYIDRKKLEKYPVYAAWFDNRPDFKPAYMKRQLVDEILTAQRNVLSHECIRMKVTHKKKWQSATCPSCGEQIPKNLMEGDICAGCGSLSYYESC
ncbi:MAG TPA: formylmethanofuran dehydrogenase subunit E family protein [Methanoregulaceae archaeon]|jgi:formylmethanofuran dehydrogenase subunit E|nr:formylmethanofuran dehydrogenase subunit E family protein [Methanoregulaceae archaeon]